MKLYEQRLDTYLWLTFTFIALSLLMQAYGYYVWLSDTSETLLIGNLLGRFDCVYFLVFIGILFDLTRLSLILSVLRNPSKTTKHAKIVKIITAFILLCGVLFLVLIEYLN